MREDVILILINFIGWEAWATEGSIRLVDWNSWVVQLISVFDKLMHLAGIYGIVVLELLGSPTDLGIL